jgi:hypothetical protein
VFGRTDESHAHSALQCGFQFALMQVAATVAKTAWAWKCRLASSEERHQRQEKKKKA